MVPADRAGRVEALRRLTRGRRRDVLFVLDDVKSEAVIGDLLPDRGSSVVIVTSREPLGGVRWDIDQQLFPLKNKDSGPLLEELLEERIPTEGEIRQAFGKVITSAHGYPFALHLAARAINGQGLWALPEIARQLPDEEPADDEQARARMLDLTFAVLARKQQQALLSLRWLPGQTFYPWMLVALASGVDEDEAWLICEQLADHRLLERITSDATGVLTLRVPDRVWAYIGTKAPADAGGEHEARQRLASAEVGQAGKDLDDLLDKAVRHLETGQVGAAVDEARGALSEGRRRSDNDRSSLDGRQAKLTAVERRALAVLAEVLSEVGGIDDARELTLTGQPRTEEPTDIVGVQLWRILGRLLRREWRLSEAVEVLTRAAAVAKRLGHPAEQALCLQERAIAESSHRDTMGRAGRTLEEAFGVLGLTHGYVWCRLLEARAIVRLNTVQYGRDVSDDLVIGELGSALVELEEARRQLPAGYGLWLPWFAYYRARVNLFLATNGGPDLAPGERSRMFLLDARQSVQAALDGFLANRHKYGMARCRLELGRVHRAEHAYDLALAQLEEARETLLLCGDRWLEAQTAHVLAELRLDQAARMASPAERVSMLDFAVAEADFAERTFDALEDDQHAADARGLHRRVLDEQRTGS